MEDSSRAEIHSRVVIKLGSSLRGGQWWNGLATAWPRLLHGLGGFGRTRRGEAVCKACTASNTRAADYRAIHSFSWQVGCRLQSAGLRFIYFFRTLCLESVSETIKTAAAATFVPALFCRSRDSNARYNCWLSKWSIQVFLATFLTRPRARRKTTPEKTTTGFSSRGATVHKDHRQSSKKLDGL